MELAVQILDEIDDLIALLRYALERYASIHIDVGAVRAWIRRAVTAPETGWCPEQDSKARLDAK